MKRILSSAIALSLFASSVSIPVFAEGSTTITPQMTWVDYNAADTAMGYIAAGSTARTGYHKISNGSIGWGNTNWGENKIAYLKVDASTITDSNIVSAVLSMDVSGSSDNKRTCGYGVLNVAYTDWDDTLTYNSANANGMTSGTTVGEMAWSSTKSSTVFETKTFDITDALVNDADRIVTLAIYETAAAGGYIKNPSVTVEHSNSSVYTVTYNVDGTVTEETVVEGEYVAEVPTTVKTGYLFKGWSKDGDTATLISTDELKAMAISADTALNAVFEKDPDYIEPIASMTVTGPSKMTLGPDPDTAVANTYSVNLLGELGTDIVANPDSRVTDYDVKWEFLGYKTENDTEGQYCDSYGSVTYNGTPATSADFNLKNVSFNFYGKIKATVTYNGQTIEASTYALILGDETSDPNVILPTAGYPSDVSIYSDELVGYSCIDETYGNSTDAILGEFCVAGSDSVKSLVLMEEDGSKFLRMTKGTIKKSGVATHKISSPSTQVIAEQDVRFNSTGGVITMTAGYPFWSSNASYGEAITLSFTGSGLTLNGVALANGDNAATVNSGTWYKVIISVDKTTETAYAQVYDKTGETLIGEVYDVAWTASCTPNYYSYGMGNSVVGTIDFNNYKMYYPTVDESSFAITTESETLSIPAAESTTLVASVKSTNGYKISDAAVWKITDESMAEGVTITPDATDSHKAVVSVSAAAVPGTLPVQVTIGGISKTIELTLTSSEDSVKFTKSASSVSIPLEEGATESVQFEAIIIDKDAQKVNDCTYAIYDKNNNTELTVLPSGITFDAATGTLTVAAGALPGTFSIRATGNNSSGESISKAVKVTVHGLSFDFGAGTDETIAEGYTSVSPDTTYTEKLGFGITGTAMAGGTGSTTDANADYLEGSFKFNAKVAKGNVYKVTVQFAGNMVSEYVSDVLSGHVRTLDAENTSNTGYTVATTEIAEHVYTIPVVDDVLDLSFTNAKVAAISIEKVDRVAGDKPHIYSVGDSTLGNNGSYGYVLARDQANYPELTALATYHNNGKGSRNLSTYYTQGWLDGVLASVKPGDIVTIGNMGTNAGGLSGSAFKAPLDYYTDAALAMGAKVILTSYTPHGAVGGYSNLYDSTTQTFTSYRTDSYDSEGIRVIYEERKNDEGILGFIDIGKNADAAFNAYVDDYEANGYESRDAAAQAIIACFPDHNHYNNNSLACQLMLNGYGDAPGIVSELVRLLGGEATEEPKISDVKNVSYTVSEDLVTITWDPVEGATGYAIYPEFGEMITMTTEPTFSMVPTDEGTYVYIIKAAVVDGDTSVMSDGVMVSVDYEEPKEGYYSYTITDGKATIIGCSSDINGAVEIPATLGGKPVVGIAERAFYGLNITSIVIPEGITTIGDNAFEDCTALESVVLPNTLSSIGRYAFSSCPIKTIELPGSLNSVGENAFCLCLELENVIISEGTTAIGAGAFMFCDKLASVTIPASVATVGEAAFDGCEALAKVYYDGNKEEWNSIAVETKNDSLINAEIICAEESSTPSPTPTVEPTEEPSNRPEVVGDNLITNDNFANGTTDWTNASNGGTYSGTLTAEAPYVHGDGQALTNTVSAGGSAVSTLRRFIPVEAGKQYYLSYYAYNTGAAVTETAFMSAFVPVAGTAFGSFNGVTFKDYVEYGGQNSWSNEPQSEVNRTRDDMDYDAGMNHKEFIFTIPEGADHILISMFAWTDPGRIYLSDFELYEVAAAEETPEPTEVPTPTPTVEPTASPSPTPTVEPTEKPTEGVYNVTFEGLDPVIVASDAGITEILAEPYTTTNGTLYFLVPLRDGGGDLTLTASNGTIEYIGVGEADGLGGDIYMLSGVSEDTTVVADWYGGPFLSITAQRNTDGTVGTEVSAGMASASAPFGMVIVAAYAEDGRLLSVQSIPCPGGNKTLNWNITGKAIFKAMWWTSLAEIEPVIEAETAVIE